MINDRLMEEVEWPGRRTRGEEAHETGEAPSGDDTDDDDVPSLLAEGEKQAVRDQIDEARAAVQYMQDQARRQLKKADDIPVDNLPQTQDAVKMLAGTHSDYGTDIPEPGENEKLPDDRITADMIERAYNVMENPGRNAFGFPIKEAVVAEEGEGVRGYQPITSPQEAAGRKDPGRGEKKSLDENVQDQQQSSLLSIGKQLAYLIGGFLFKFVGKVFKSMANQLRGMFAFSINAGPVDVTINLAKPIVAALLWMATLFFELAEYLLNKALGNDYTTRETAREADETRDEFEEVNDNLDDPAEAFGFEAMAASEPEAAGGQRSAGPKYLQSAYQVMRTTANEAQRRDNPRLAKSLDLFDRARNLRRDVEAHDEIARSWGAPDAPDERPSASPGRTGQSRRLARAEDDPSDFNC